MGALFQTNGEETLFIKRIVGLPGDRVEAVQGRLRVNGQPWPEEPLAGISIPDFPAQRAPPGMLFGTIHRKA
jgi:signal peptidase I